MFKTPLLAVKAVTDIVDGERPTGEEFLENLHKTVETLTVSPGACQWDTAFAPWCCHAGADSLGAMHCWHHNLWIPWLGS